MNDENKRGDFLIAKQILTNMQYDGKFLDNTFDKFTKTKRKKGTRRTDTREQYYNHKMGKIHIRGNTIKIYFKIIQKDKHKNSLYNGKYNRKIPHKEKRQQL